MNVISQKYNRYVLTLVIIGIALLVAPSTGLFSAYSAEYFSIDRDSYLLTQDNGILYLIAFVVFFALMVVLSSYVMIIFLLIANLLTKKITLKEFFLAAKCKQYPNEWTK